MPNEQSRLAKRGTLFRRKRSDLIDFTPQQFAQQRVADGSVHEDDSEESFRHLLEHGAISVVGLPTPELPLFGGDDAAAAPLISRASAPRPPLAVRRATPDVPRLRADTPRTQQLDLSTEDLGLAIDKPTQPADRAQAGGWLRPESKRSEAAGLAARLVAVGIDLTLLAGIDVAVVYFTMEICGLTRIDLPMLPIGPLLAFLVLQNGGYFVAFTAGGQTMGKMAMGIKVVSADTNGSLDVGRSALRTLIWAALAVPAGLGFVSALFSRDHRGLHDRCAGTRVVRATA